MPQQRIIFIVYDACMICGAGSVTAGVGMRFGLWAGLVTGGALMMALTRLGIGR